MCGTSVAAPHVSGVAAMVWSANSSLTGAEVKDIVCNTNRDDSWDLNIVNAESAVERALNWESDGEETATEPQNGGILNFVVDKDDENTKIDHADVTAVKVNGESYTTTTDADGHFELFLPEGTYDVTVSRWDYCPYTWKDIEVRTIILNDAIFSILLDDGTLVIGDIISILIRNKDILCFYGRFYFPFSTLFQFCPV